MGLNLNLDLVVHSVEFAAVDLLNTLLNLNSNFGFEFKFEFGNLAVHSVDIMKIAPLQRCYWNGSSIFLWAIGRRGFGHWLNEKLTKL